MQSHSKNKPRLNALKHGAFASEPLIQDECQEDFDTLHRECIDEFQPSGRAEEEVVLTIAQYMWRKRRGARFFAEKAKAAQGHPDMEKLSYVEEICEVMEKFGPAEAWQFNDLLPEPFGSQIRELVSPPPKDAGREWTQQTVRLIREHADDTIDAYESQVRRPSVRAKTAGKLQELAAQQLVVDERLDQLIDKALKRLAMLKTFKEIMASSQKAHQNTLPLPN